MSDNQGNKAEHRLLTIMFSDMVDSTGHQYRLEPERFAVILRTYRQIVFDRATRHGGYIARVVGDGVLVFFGWPSATGKDAQAAVSCALDIAARISQGIDSIPIGVRLAIETGWVLVGDLATANAPRSEIEHATVVGSAANVAARLQQLARRNGVIVGEGTLDLLRDRFITEPVDTTGIKLPFPVRAAHVLADAGDGNPLSWLTRRYVREGTVLIGRQALFRDLLTHWQAARDGAGRALRLTGDAGIGKSHLLAALLHAVADDQPATSILFCTPAARDRPFQPVVEWLRQTIGISPDAFPDDIRAQTVRYAAAMGLPDPAGEALATLLGAATGSPGTPEQLRRQLFAALAAILGQIADDRTLLILAEDLHWADPSTIELLDMIAAGAAGRRMLLIATDRNAAAAALPHFTDLPIAPLDLAAARDLAGTIAERLGIELQAQEWEQIAARAEGVALFVEEFVRSVADRRASARGMPGSIGQLMASRLDTLGAARPLAQIASVVGREVPLSMLAELSGMAPEEFDAAVERLTGSDVMMMRAADDRAVLAFRHALLTEAAYGAMQQPQRRSLHLRVARALQQSNPALATIAPAVLAHHLAEGGEPREAAPLFRSAARAMLQTGAYAEAETHARRSLALFEATADRSEILTALLPLGEALIGARGYADPDVQHVYEQGTRLALQQGTAQVLLPSLRGLTSYYQVRGPMRRAHDLSAQVLRIAQVVGDPVLICQAEQRHGWCLMCQGRLLEAEAMMESALSRHVALPSERRQTEYEDISIRIHLAWLDWLMRGASAMTQRAALALARLSEAPPLRAAYVLGFAAATQQMAGDVAAVVGYAERSGALAREFGMPYWIAWSDALAGWAASARGDPEGLLRLRRGLAGYDRTQGRVLLPYLLGLVADAERRVGTRVAAFAALDRADAVVAEIGAGLYRAPLLRLRALVTAGNDRLALLDAAKRVAEAQGALAFAALVTEEMAGNATMAPENSGGALGHATQPRDSPPDCHRDAPGQGYDCCTL